MTDNPQSPTGQSRADEIFFGGLLGTALAGVLLLFFYHTLTVAEIITGLLTGCILGIIAGSFLHHISAQTQYKIHNILVYLILSPFVLLPALMVILFGWTLLTTGAEAVTEYFSLPEVLGTYIKTLINFITLLIVGYIFWEIVFGRVSKKLLVNKVDLEELEVNHLHDGIPFGHMKYQWEDFKSKMQKDDEIWFWSTSPRTWDMLVGRCGYVIVRSGRPTRHTKISK